LVGPLKATEPKNGKPGNRPGRSAKRDKDRVTREVTLKAGVPKGSRFKGYKSILVRELVLASEVVRYRRERWITPEGKTIIAPVPAGVIGGFGPGLRRFCLAMHAEGQVTTERLTSILNGIGVELSKRQVVRMLTADLDKFVAEDHAVLHAGPPAASSAFPSSRTSAIVLDSPPTRQRFLSWLGSLADKQEDQSRH
jgi:hypothetical protein